MNPTATGQGAPWPKSRYAFAGAPFVALASLRSAPFRSLATLASLHFAPVRYDRATNYATAKAPLDFGLVGPSLWTSMAIWLYSTNLVSFALGV